MAVTTETRGATLIITIDRPEARNAIDLETAEGIAAAATRLDSEDALAVGIITGSHGTFSAGMDLKAFAAGRRPIVEGRGFAGIVEAPPSKPLIAAVEGFALAGGFEIALTADLIVAASDAVFGLPEVTRGLTAAAGGLFRLAERIPRNIAMELLLTGRRLSATEAAELGLVNRLSDRGDALAAAIELADTIAGNAPLAVRTSKKVLQESSEWLTAERFARQEPFVAAVRASADAAEGARSFAEKRPPVWSGA